MGASVTKSRKKFYHYAVRAENNIYQADSDGFLMGYLHLASGVGLALLTGKEGPADPPASIMQAAMIDDTYEFASFCLPVRKGRYYKAEYSVITGAPVVDIYIEWQPFK